MIPPNGWRQVKLSEVAKTTSGGTPSRSNVHFYVGSIPWVKSGELNFNTIVTTEEHISDLAIRSSSAKIIPEGTLLIALYGATVGRLAFLGIDAATNQAVCAITPSDELDKHYLYYYLLYKKDYLLTQRIGGAQPNISQTILKQLPINLPPPSEQRIILQKIEELFSELDTGRSYLEKSIGTVHRDTESMISSLRQAILHKAFTGGLS